MKFPYRYFRKINPRQGVERFATRDTGYGIVERWFLVSLRDGVRRISWEWQKTKKKVERLL